MRNASMLASLSIALVLAAFAGCGGATETVDFNAPGDGDGGGAGDSNPGEDAGIDEDSGLEDGSVEDGDIDAGDIDAGDGDPDADAEPPVVCPPPMDPTKAALCLVIEPEPIDFVAADEKLDGKGLLIVQVFDKALPGNGAALDEKLSPPQPPGGSPATKDLSELTAQPFRFEGLPTEVYPRAFFVDDVAGAQPDSLVPGTWIGGLDVSNGLAEDMPLRKVTLEAGKGTTIKLPLTAIRKLTVTVSRSTAPVSGGNAQGKLTVLALGSQQLDDKTKMYGMGESACANLSANGATTKVEGVVVGKGPYWITGILDDFQQGNLPVVDIPAGALASLELVLSPFSVKVPDKNKLTYAANAYEIEASIELNQQVPRQGGAPDAISCP